jgi:UDP-glucose 4-epimerase
MEMNVIGTMQLLAACQKSDSVRRVVVKSTTAVYGASARDLAVFTEDMDRSRCRPAATSRTPSRSRVRARLRALPPGRGGDPAAVDQLHRPAHRDRDGPRYFSLPVVPTVFGYDAGVQLVLEADALAMLQRAAGTNMPGVFNVGGDGMLLSQAIRRAGPGATPGASGGRRAGQPAPPRRGTGGLLAGADAFLDIGRVVDITRLRTEFATPRWTTVQAFDDFVNDRGLRPLIDPRQVAAVEHGMLDGLARGMRGTRRCTPAAVNRCEGWAYTAAPTRPCAQTPHSCVRMCGHAEV